MNPRYLLLSGIAVFAAMLCGCDAQPPKCSAPETVNMVLDEFAMQFAKFGIVPQPEIRKHISLETPLAVSLDEKVRRLTCQATLKAGSAIQIPVGFVSLLDDENRHMVIVNDISGDDGLSLLFVLQKAYERSVSVQGAGRQKASAAQARIAKSPLEALVGLHPADALKSPIINQELRNILGDNFDDLTERITVASPVVQSGSYIVGSGCMAHACDTQEGIFIVDKDSGKAYAGINAAGSLKVFGSSPDGLPIPLARWYRDRGGNP